MNPIDKYGMLLEVDMQQINHHHYQTFHGDIVVDVAKWKRIE